MTRRPRVAAALAVLAVAGAGCMSGPSESERLAREQAEKECPTVHYPDRATCIEQRLVELGYPGGRHR